MSGALPPGWRHGTLADVIGSISTGVSVNGEDRPVRNGEVGVLKITAVLRGVFEPEHHKAVVPADLHRVACPVQGGTVLVSRSNTADLVGASAYVPEDVPGLFLPDKLWALTAAEGINPRWLGYVLADPTFRPQLAGASNGTSGSMKNIPQEAFLRLGTVIPPRTEQDGIIEVLAMWDSGIDLAEEAHATAQYLAESLVAPLLQPEARGGWRRARLGDLAAVNPALDVSASEDQVAFYGMADLSEQGIFRAEPEMRPREAVRTGFTRFQRGDVLVAKITPCFENGKAGLLREAPTQACFGSTEFHVLRSTGAPPEVLAGIVRHRSFREQGARSMTGSAGQQRVPAQFLRDFPLVLPAPDHMERLAAALRSASHRAELLGAYAAQLRQQKSSLMSRLLSGSLSTSGGSTSLSLEVADA